jgi:DNA-binding beta-propeller fold protein YncE
VLTQVVAGRVYDYSHCVGEYMGGMQWPGEGFALPIATAVAPGDVVYVLSRGMESTDYGVPLQARAFGVRVGRFRLPPEPGGEEHLTTFGSYGTGDGEFVWPAGIALDSAGNVYVTDEWTDQVAVFNGDGESLGKWGGPGSGPGEFDRPSGITIDAQDNVYVVDSLNHRVQRLTVDGGYLGEWGGLGSSPSAFDSPWGVTIDGGRHVYVADHKNDRVQRFTPEGEFVAQYGATGTGAGQLSRPSDVAVDPDGDVYVADWANNRVQVFDGSTAFLTTILGDAQELSKWAALTVEANPDIQKARRRASLEPEWRFAMPTGVTFDPVRSRLIVADTQRYRLQVYSKQLDYVEAQANL